MIVNSILISAITLSGKTTVSVQAEETDISAESETDQQILFDDTVRIFYHPVWSIYTERHCQ